MASKSKMTGFARFVIFLLIATPLVFSLASYLKGDDPLKLVSIIKEKVIGFTDKSSTNDNPNIQSAKDDNTKAPSTSTSATPDQIIDSKVAKLTDELKFKDKVIDSLYLDNTKLKKEIEAIQKELKLSKEQISKIKKAVEI
ncbi:MAG: hypothetical protein KA010_03460 [Saprospiraceae bacterium]|nr:hypothetical protein [Saprospiraceae bacterium]